MTRHKIWCRLLNRLGDHAVVKQWKEDKEGEINGRKILWFECTRCGRRMDWNHPVREVDEFTGRDTADS